MDKKSTAMGTGGDTMTQRCCPAKCEPFLEIILVLGGCTFSPWWSANLYWSGSEAKAMELLPDSRQIRRLIFLCIELTSGIREDSEGSWTEEEWPLEEEEGLSR